ncbi:amidohydrolase [Brumicola nitratireducens]|uniref:Amidohydrolase n=1 Tax=Glaciecola nitratireducens (strain JCM 12485 / KCTC 12276 / FR1064) TaxID=1085623 RepID=G4QG04_GLANF|nr:amidohydrolase [Glaciecola nitratireducens]AEP29095.1 amidohydrolase [Glaciecola nitratireducens FR1064]
MTLFRKLPLLLLCGALVACQPANNQSTVAIDEEVDKTSSSSATIADRVLTGGTIITVDPDQPEAQAIALKDGRILAVGNVENIASYIGDSTEVINLDDRVAIPGFIEGHGHFLSLGQALMTLDLVPTRSFQDIVDMVAQAAKNAEPGEWITGRGWHQERWGKTDEMLYDGIPHHRSLSAVSPNNPVFLIHASGHGSLVNEMALSLGGIDSNTPDTEGGTIVRDNNGDATGYLRQAAQRPIYAVLNDVQASLSEEEKQAQFERKVKLAGEESLRFGVTSFHDMGSNFEEIQRLKVAADAGQLPIRLHMAVRWETNESLRARAADFRMVGHANGFLTVRALKRGIDGALGTHGAWMLDPYSDKPETSGLPQTSMENLRETAQIALDNGFQLNTHAIGDRGNREAMDIYEDLMGARLDEDLRWRIEHAQTLHPDEVPRFAKLGVIASMQGVHATSDGPWVPQRIGEERAQNRAYVWRSLLDAGATICNGTDVPVEAISPIESYIASVTRRMESGEQFYPEQSMSRMEALYSYTMGCAKAVFDEDELGSLTPGKRADIVVLNGNPLTLSEEELSGLEVEMTLIEGEVRYARPN